MKRRQFLQRGTTLLGGAAMLSACGSGGGSTEATPNAPPAPPIRPATGQANALTVSVDPNGAGRAVNRMVLGQNLQWVDRGDEMFDATAKPRPDMTGLAQSMGSTTLRYPGGLQSDTYHWARGMGLLTERGLNEHANARRMQPTLVGTQEFLELCEALGATPLITVNLASGTPEEAAAWVKQVNIDRLTSSKTGNRLPKVPLWELGNEPYLKPEEQPTLWMTPGEFSQRARQFANAMKAVDPDIQLSLPLTSDKRNGFQATPYQGFSREVMATAVPGVSHVSLHNAYVPFGMDRAYSKDELYWGAMAGGRSVAADLQAMRGLLAELQPGNKLAFAITEHNALFTLGKGDSDQLTKSITGALAVADVLRVLAHEPDVAMAHFWSLSGNGFFGALHQEARLRPTGQVLALFSEALRGQLLPASMSAPTVSTPGVGASAAVGALPVAEVLVTREGQQLRLLVIHKDYANPATLKLTLGAARIVSGQVSVLGGGDVFDISDRAGLMSRTDSAWPANAQLDLPPHSVTLITLNLATSA
jgi:alpha-L-arabinofuranosidase